MKRERKAIRQGGIAALGHAAGSLLTGVTALLLSRALGPSEFAIYALCTSINGVLRIVGRCGINAGLLSQGTDPTDEEYGTGLTTMLVLSVLAALLGVVVMPWAAQFSNVHGLVGPGIAIAVMLPLHVLPLPAVTRLERQLRFQPMVVIELVTQAIGFAVGIALAFGGAGVWGPIAGGALRAGLYAGLPWIVSRETVHFAWNPAIALRLIRFGVGYVVATASVQCRSLAFLSLTGRFVGAEAVGIVGFSLRAVALAGPVRAAAARVVLPSLAPIVCSPRILRRAVRTAAETEVLISLPLLSIAILALHIVVTNFSRDGWELAIGLFPAVAAGALLGAPHAAVFTALYVKGRFLEPIMASVFHIAILAVTLAALGGEMGIDACGVASVLVWPAAWIAEWSGRRILGTEWSRESVAWALAGAASYLAWIFGVGLVVLSIFVIGLTLRPIIERTKKIIGALLPARQ